MRDAENDRAYARLIAAIVAPRGAAALRRGRRSAASIEHARAAGRATARSCRPQIGPSSTSCARPTTGPGEAGASWSTPQHVQQAIDAQIYRSDRLRDAHAGGRSLRETRADRHRGRARSARSTGCRCSQLGDFAFGRPSRITARVRMGKGEVVDIEREVELGGPLHSKGVLILSGFLARPLRRRTQPLSLGGEPGVRAVLRRRRRRQRLVGRALRAALGARRACRSSSRWR